MKKRHRILLLGTGVQFFAWVFSVFLFPASVLTTQSQIFGVQSRAFSSPPDFQRWAGISREGTLMSAEIVYGDGTPDSFSGGIYGMTLLDGVYYGTEFVDSSGATCRLLSFSSEAFVQARRVSTEAIGFPAIEGLASANGILYGISVDFEGHRSSLISIDPQTGQGSLIGTGDYNVILTGLAYHPGADKLYGCGVPFGSGPDSVDDNNLYEINLQTGQTTLVGPLGADLQGLAYDEILGLIGVFQSLYTIDTGTGEATAIGEAHGFSHDGNPSNGIYSLASSDGGSGSDFPEFEILAVSLVHTPALSVVVEWETEPGGVYQLQSGNLQLTPVEWDDASVELVANGNKLTHVFALDGAPGSMILQVVRVR
jgi:hypothetical protein